MVAATTIMVIVIVWSVFSGPLDRRGITSAMVFTVAGLAVGASALGWLDVSVPTDSAHAPDTPVTVFPTFVPSTTGYGPPG